MKVSTTTKCQHLNILEVILQSKNVYTWYSLLSMVIKWILGHMYVFVALNVHLPLLVTMALKSFPFWELPLPYASNLGNLSNKMLQSLPTHRPQALPRCKHITQARLVRPSDPDI